MPQFNRQAVQRIASVVKRVEGILPTEDMAVRLPSVYPIPQEIRRFELKDDLTADDTTAEAYLLYRDIVTKELLVSKTTFNLWSFTGWTGTARDDSDPDNVIQGTRGVAVKWPDVDVWEVISADRGFDRITGLTTAAVETTDGTFEIYNISVVKGADPREGTSSTAETVTIVNTPAWKMADDQRIFAHWDERLNSGDGGWEVYLVYSTVTVVTDVTISGGKLKKKTKTIGVFYAGTESDWSAGTDVHESADYDEITFMTNVQVSGTTLQKKTRTVKAYNPSDNAESDWSTWHTGEECE